MSEIWVNESPISLVAGAEPTYTIVFDGATSVSVTSATQEIYKNGAGSDLSSTLCTGSLATNTVDTVTLKKLQSLVGGNTYVVVVKCTVNGVVEVRKLNIEVQKAKELQ